MHFQSSLVRFVSLIAVVFFISKTAGAQCPLADKVPADAVFYVGWGGADALQAAYQPSDLAAFIDHSNFSAVAHELLPKLWGKIGSQDKATADALHAALPLLWKHPAAFYVANVTIKDDGEPDSDVALICDAGADAPQLLNQLQSLATAGHLAVISRGSIVGLGGTHASTDAPTSVLAAAPAFTLAMNSLQTNPALAIFIDGKQLLAKADESAHKDAQAAPIWPKIKDALGISNIGSYAMTAGFDQGNWMTAASLQAPGPRKGLLAVIEPKPIDPALLARIPATAMSVSVENFDTALLFDTIGNAMAVTPQGDKTFHQASGIATVALGRNFRRQILASLGSQWVMYSDASTNGLVVLNDPANPDDASDGLVSATFGLVNQANQQIPGARQNPLVTVNQKTVKGVNLTSAETKFVSPSFAVKDRVLYLGLSADPVVNATAVPSTQTGNDILHSAGFTSALKRLGVSSYASFSYTDIPNSAPSAIAEVNQSITQLRQMLAKFQIDVPELQLPTAEQMQGHLSPALAVSWADDKGIYSKSVSPFPGSEMVLGDPRQSLVGLGSVSLVGSAVLPAIAKSRETARRVASMSNERQLCMALIMYSNDHQGALPPDLNSCVEYLGGPAGALHVMVDPQSGTMVPAEIQNGTREAQLAWLKDHAEYEVLITDKKMADIESPSTTAILAPKDAESSTKPVAIGFVDGHVELVQPDRLHKLLHPDEHL